MRLTNLLCYDLMNDSVKKILDKYNQTLDGEILPSEFAFLCHYFEASDLKYGKKAHTTGIPYIIHILEGIVYLDSLEFASFIAKSDIIKAFILHPVFQMDEDIEKSFISLGGSLNIDQRVILLAMEYRKVANSFLPIDNRINHKSSPCHSPMRSVNVMLKADKMQNYKDFIFNKNLHIAKCSMREKLDVYFERWFDFLKIDFKEFYDFTALIKQKFSREVYNLSVKK